MDVAVIGGTGEEGFGLSLRLAAAGHRVIIGSRSTEKGSGKASEANGLVAARIPVEGTTNEEATTAGEVVFVTVPYAGQADIYRAIKPAVRAGQIVCDATSPLATAVGGRAWQVIRPWHGSAAEAAKFLHVDVSRVRQRLRERSLFGIEHEGSWRLPRFQFERRLVIPGLAQILKALPPDLFPLDVIDWFLLPDSDLQLDSDTAPLSPREWLLSGRPIDAVVMLARDLTRA